MLLNVRGFSVRRKCINEQNVNLHYAALLPPADWKGHTDLYFTLKDKMT